MNNFLPFALAFALAAFLTGLTRWFCRRFGVLALPRERDVHRAPMPRLGGVALFLTFVLASAFYLLIVRSDLAFSRVFFAGIDKQLLGIWLGSAIIVLAMLLDDIRGLSAAAKLFFQFLAVVVIIASGVGIDHLSNPFGNPINLNSVYIPIITIDGVVYHFSLWSDLLTLVWLIGMMNVLNFVDGVDGLAGGIATIAALTIYFLSMRLDINQPATALLALILAGAASGFLIWNFPPAKIFMGDSGSMFLGFILGVLAIISGGKIATSFLVLGFPIIDGVLVAVGRLLRRQNPFTTPDKTHLHHRFLKAGFTVRQSVLILYLIAAAFGFIALRMGTIDKVIAAFVLIILVVVLVKVLSRLSSKG